VRLGVSLGIIKDIRIETLTALMVEVMPATLTLASKIPLKCEEERDKYRAELVQARLSPTA
jgi:protein-arginine kinase